MHIQSGYQQTKLSFGYLICLHRLSRHVIINLTPDRRIDASVRIMALLSSPYVISRSRHRSTLRPPLPTLGTP